MYESAIHFFISNLIIFPLPSPPSLEIYSVPSGAKAIPSGCGKMSFSNG